MSFKTLLAWIHVHDLEDIDPISARPLVKAALEELSDDDPRREPLQAIENELWEGFVPADQMRALADDWEGYESEETVSDGDQLEQEFRELAAALPDTEWHTTFYEKALQAVESIERGQEDAFYTALEEMRTRLEESWEPYFNSPVAAEEVTAETVVGHRLLQDGVERWLNALDEMEQVATGESELTYDDALATAEEANRLLVAVQRLARRVARAAGV